MCCSFQSTSTSPLLSPHSFLFVSPSHHSLECAETQDRCTPPRHQVPDRRPVRPDSRSSVYSSFHGSFVGPTACRRYYNYKCWGTCCSFHRVFPLCFYRFSCPVPLSTSNINRGPKGSTGLLDSCSNYDDAVECFLQTSSLPRNSYFEFLWPPGSPKILWKIKVKYTIIVIVLTILCTIRTAQRRTR